METDKIKWGIVGAGKIAAKFAEDLNQTPSASLYAVASRDKTKAATFAETHSIEKSFGDYNSLFNDEAVDIIYIATPHSNHASLGIEAMNHGKHILCEKPIAVNSKELQKMIEASERNDVFMMEALWSRFNPSICQIYEILQTNIIGELRMLDLNFCFNSGADVASRVFNPDLAGGALLDIGIYPLFLTYLLCGNPLDIQATSIKHETGVDAQTAVVLKYKNCLANTYASLILDRDMPGYIYGSQGYIKIHSRWHETNGFTVFTKEGQQSYRLPLKGNGFVYEIEEVHDCLSQNKRESTKWSHKNSLDLMKILDDVRLLIGLKYPFEN